MTLTMIFRQLFEGVSCTCSYLIASHRGTEALIINPVLEKVDRHLQLMHLLSLERESVPLRSGS